MNFLQSNWTQLASSYQQDDSVIRTLWTELSTCYSESHRHYHNLDHIAYMITLADLYNGHLQQPHVVRFSIFYHDIIYKTIRQDNEYKSAVLATERLTKLGVPDAEIKKCCQQISATKNHEPTHDNDTDYLLDFDLAILGDTTHHYDAYAKKIRNEYSIYPDFLYNRGRKMVLHHFLEMESIYKTETFRMEREAMARENILRELSSL